METPRTNKNAGYYCGHGIKKNSDLVIDPNGPFVLADFARELERENSRLRFALEQIAHDPANAVTYFEDKWRQIAKQALLLNNRDDQRRDSGSNR